MTKKILTVLMYVLTFLLVSAILGNCIVLYSFASLGTGDIMGYITCVFRILVCTFAIYYVVAGCKKEEGATYFKAFMNLFALAMLLEIANLAAYTTFSVVLFALSFGSLTVLSCALDLGEKKSTLLAGIVAVTGAAQFISFTMMDSVGTVTWISIGTYLLLALMCILMVYAKYQDKKERGSK